MRILRRTLPAKALKETDMKSIKVILAGIVIILASLFFMGIYIIPEGFTLGLFISGITVSIIGLFFVKESDENNDPDDDYDDSDYDE